MFIYDLAPEQNITILISVGETTLSFESKVQESYPKKKMIFADAVMKEGKPLSFRGVGILVNILVTFKDEKPLLFKNVTTKLLKKNDGEYIYCFNSLAEGIIYNRRENFRCYVGLNSSAQRGLNSAAHPVIIRDVSYTGFAIVTDTHFTAECGQTVHTVLNDQPQENGTVYSFHLFGIVARIQELDNDKLLYGCRLSTPVHGLDKYIMEKERIRLRKSNGGNL